MTGPPAHICQLTEAGRGWCVAALSLLWRWWGVPGGELAEGPGRLLSTYGRARRGALQAERVKLDVQVARRAARIAEQPGRAEERVDLAALQVELQKEDR